MTAPYISRDVYAYDGETTEYAVSFPYQKADHVQVRIYAQGEELPAPLVEDDDYEYLSGAVIDLEAAITELSPAEGDLIDIRRVTPYELPLLSAPSTLTAASLNVRLTTIRYIAEEANDAVVDLGARALISDSGTVPALPEGNGPGYLYRTGALGWDYREGTQDAALRDDLAADNGSSIPQFKPTGAVEKRGVNAVLQEYGQLVTGFAEATDTTLDAAFGRAILNSRHIILPPGTHDVSGTVTLDAHGVGGRCLELMAGAELRGVGSETGPVLFVQNSEWAVLGHGASSKVKANRRSPEGIVLYGHPDMETGGVDNVFTTLADFMIEGQTAYGQTTGDPDVGLRCASSQVDGKVSYFAYGRNIVIQSVNQGLMFHGDANGHRFFGFHFQWIGNSTLSSARDAVLFNGGLENILLGFIFHYSPGSTAIRMIDCDNTANGGIITPPHLNIITGITEQDPTPSGGKGLVAKDSDCTATGNQITLVDNCPGNDIGDTFLGGNSVHLTSRHTTNRTLWAPSLSITGGLDNPDNLSSLSLYMDQALQQAHIRSIWEGADWRRLVMEAREYYFMCDNIQTMSVARLDRGGWTADTAILTDAADDTAAAGAGVAVGQFYRTGSTIKIRMA